LGTRRFPSLSLGNVPKCSPRRIWRMYQHTSTPQLCPSTCTSGWLPPNSLFCKEGTFFFLLPLPPGFWITSTTHAFAFFALLLLLDASPAVEFSVIKSAHSQIGSSELFVSLQRTGIYYWSGLHRKLIAFNAKQKLTKRFDLTRIKYPIVCIFLLPYPGKQA
jgi:hypothetical protein